MFLNKAALITTLSLFFCSACVSTKDYQAQQAKISSLQAELLQVIENNQQIQSELTICNSSLQDNQNRIAELTRLVEKTEQESQKKVAAATSACNKKVTKVRDKTLLGESEWVYISRAKSNYKARIDTGIANSSINASTIERFERDGEKWVRFTLSNEQKTESQIIEAKIERIVRMAQSTNLEEGSERRVVVKLHARIGDISQQAEFTLNDRSQMEYPVLIGRAFLRDIILVDVSKEYIHPQYKTKE